MMGLKVRESGVGGQACGLYDNRGPGGMPFISFKGKATNNSHQTPPTEASTTLILL